MSASRRQLELMVEAKRRGIEVPTQQESSAASDVAKSVGGGFNVGLSNVLGAPVDLANAALSLVGLDSERPVGGSESIQSGLANIGATVQPGEELPDPFIARIAEEVGAATVPFGVIGGAARGGQLIKPVIDLFKAAPTTSTFSPLVAPLVGPLGAGAQGGRFLKPILDFFKTSPKTLAGVEVGASTTAGIGAAVAQQAFPDNVLAEVAGQLVGGLASPTTLLSEQSPRAIAAVKNTFRPATIKGAQDVASQVAQKAVRGQPAQVARQLEQPTDFVKGAAITPAGQTGDPGLLSLEKAVAKKSSEAADSVSEALTQTNRAVTEELTALRGQGRIDDTVSALADRTSRVTNALKARSQQAIQAANNKLTALGPNVSREQANKIVRTEIDNSLTDARLQEKDIWSAVDETVPASVSPARKALADIKSARDPDIDDPSDIPEFVNRLLRPQRFDKDGIPTNNALSDTETVGRVQKLRSRVLGEIRAERAKDAPNRNKVRILTDISDNLLTGLGEKADDKAIKAAMAYSRELNQRFTQGTVGKLLGFEKTGEAAVSPALTLEKSIGKAGPAGAVGLEDVRAAADTAPTSDAVNDFLKERFVRKMTTAGRIAPQRARQFLSENKEILDRNPELRKQFESAITSQEKADAISKGVDKTIKSITDQRKTASSIVLNAPVGGEVSKVLKAKNPALAMKQIVRKVSKDPEALSGLKAAFIDEMMKSSKTAAVDFNQNPILSGRKMGDFLEKNKAIITKSGLFTKEESARLARVARTAKAIDTEIAGGRDMKDIIDTAPDAITELISSVIGARIGAQLGGGTSGGSIQAAGRGAGFARKLTSKIPIGKVSDVLNQAILDKKLMAQLLRKPRTAKEVAATRKAIRGFLANTLPTEEQEQQ